jgi:hypothetical protein
MKDAGLSVDTSLKAQIEAAGELTTPMIWTEEDRWRTMGVQEMKTQFLRIDKRFSKKY